MPQHIDQAPDAVTAAGQEFDYTDPPRFATLVLVNAPLDPDHVNIGLNRAAYDAFIDAELAATPDPTIPGGRAWAITDLTIQSPEHDLQLGVEYETASTFYNYGRMTIGSRRWYVFYTPEYKTKTVTVFRADVDEVASYDWSLGYSLIERGHVAVAAALTDPYGSRYLTAPEPVDAAPTRGVLDASILSSHPSDWTVLVVSDNDLRGGTGYPFFDRHVEADLIANAADKATIATIDSAGTIQTHIPDANYPWARGTSGTVGLVDVISPGHHVTNPGGTVASGWAWHVANAAGRGGVDWDYNFEPFKAMGDGVVDHFFVAGVGDVTRLTLNTPIVRTSPQQASGHDQFGPIYSIWYEHTSVSIDGPCLAGDVIGTSGDGGGLYDPHLHVHALSNTSNVAGADNRSCPWGFLGDATPLLDVAVPKVTASPVSTIDGVSAGGGVYLFTMAGFARYMTIMQGAPWVLSGIIDVRLVPAWAVSGGGDAVYSPEVPPQDPADPLWEEASAIPVFRAVVTSAPTSPTVLPDWRNTVLAALGVQGWTKLVTAPFTDLLVGNGDGTQSFRPDQWQTSGLGFQAVTGAAHGDPSIRLIPTGYNDLGPQLGLDSPVGGKAGIAKSGFGIAASSPGSNDLTPYLAAYSSYTSWIVAKKNQTLAEFLGLNNIVVNMGVQGIQSALGGNIIGGVASLATASIQANNAITMLDAKQDMSFDITAFQLGLSGEASVATFDTWYQTLSSQSGEGTPSALASAWRAIIGQAFQAIVVVPTSERVYKLVSMWKRYGYMIGQAFTPTRLDPMTKFSYWQTDGAVILGAVPQQRRQTIAAAFDRGTTVWTNVADIGTDVSGSNTPRTGIGY